MKLTVYLIPIPPPTTPTDPDPPNTVFHYTTGLKLKQIINSGCIRPSTAPPGRSNSVNTVWLPCH